MEVILKTFTRFFVPGLSFIVFAIVVPFGIVNRNMLLKIDGTTGISILLIMSILVGYVLDAIKAYRWTPAILDYNKQKKILIKKLSKNQTIVDSNNPDYYISELWKNHNEVYERLFFERAEWVMILETSFSLLIGALSAAFAIFYRIVNMGTIHHYYWSIPIIFIISSILASWNGIGRMSSHDSKLLAAVKDIKKDE